MPPKTTLSAARPAADSAAWSPNIPTFEDDGEPISPTQPAQRTSATATGQRSVGFAIGGGGSGSSNNAPALPRAGTCPALKGDGHPSTQPTSITDGEDEGDELQPKASNIGFGKHRSAAELYAMSSFRKLHTPQQMQQLQRGRESSEDDGPDRSTRSDNSDMSAVSMATSTRSGQAAHAAGATTLRCAGFKVRVPFTAWTFLAMLVPIGLLVAVLSMKVAATAGELTAVSEHKALATAVGECSSWLMRERGTMGPWLARGSDTDWANLQRVRASGDAACAGLLRELQALAGDHESWRGEVEARVVFAAQQAQWRERVNLRTPNGRAAREFFTASIAEAGGLLIRVADELRQSARAFTELQLLIGSRNYIGLARGVGNAIAASDPNATTGSSAVVHEYIAGHAQARLGFGVLRGAAGAALRADLDAWQSGDAAARMWGLLDTMADVSGGGVLAIQQNNATEWWAVVSAGLDALYAVEQAHLQRLHDAEAARAEVRDSGLIMGCGVLACLAAAGLLAWRQTQVRRQLEDQVARMQKTKAAVSAFVPRFFLHKMGYTSITQVRAGESTNVALAMLFSDIRRFTTVSEGMESTELFDWVQGYFQRMTTIVEGRRGNVNQFVGDAMFAVFGTCNDALECAVDMQADVQQLNVQRLCADSSIIPIEVGVGIHHDVVALGILGDSKRHTCTAISASVNLASRLEGLTKQLGCNIIASEAVVTQLSTAEAACLRMRRVGAVVVKGSGAPVVVHDVFHADPRELQLYKSASREAFEAVARACLGHEPGPEIQADLQRELRAFAKRFQQDRNNGSSDGNAASCVSLGLPDPDFGLGGSERGSVMVPSPQVAQRLALPAGSPSHAALSTTSANAISPARPTMSNTPQPNAAPMPSEEVDESASSRGLPTPLPPAASAVDASTARLLELLQEHGVRDYAIEAIAVLADGSGTLRFTLK